METVKRIMVVAEGTRDTDVIPRKGFNSFYDPLEPVLDDILPVEYCLYRLSSTIRKDG